MMLLIVGISFATQAQKARKIDGLIKSDSSFLQVINVLNKTTELGTTSDHKGAFSITVKEGDSLLFSSLVYVNRTIRISKTHLDAGWITVYLEPDYYQLDEVVIDPKLKINYNDIYIEGMVLERDAMSKKTPTSAEKFTNPIPGDFGINFVHLFSRLTKKGRLKRKKKKQDQLLLRQQQKEFPALIIQSYGEEFFIDWLKIPKKEIYLFLDYCQANGLNDHLNSSEFRIKDFLVKQSLKFREIKN